MIGVLPLRHAYVEYNDITSFAGLTNEGYESRPGSSYQNDHICLSFILPSSSIKMSSSKAQEPHLDPQRLTSNPSHNSNMGVDYQPHPSSSIPLSASRQKIVDSICRLYSGSASEDDMEVYAGKAIYDDPWSYCDTRYKIAGQWYGGFQIFLNKRCQLSYSLVQS